MLRRRRRARSSRHIHPRTFDAMHVYPLLGIDEVATGCIAGPIAAAGCILPQDPRILDLLEEQGLKDSKQMTENALKQVEATLRRHCPFQEVRFLSAETVSTIGPQKSLDQLFCDIIETFLMVCEGADTGAIVIDGKPSKGVHYTFIPVYQGDQKSLTISAASVLAKVARDACMVELAAEYPGYGFEQNKGYPTKGHKQALLELGVCDIHRRNTKPVRAYLNSVGPNPGEPSGT